MHTTHWQDGKIKMSGKLTESRNIYCQRLMQVKIQHVREWLYPFGRFTVFETNATESM